MMESIFFDSFKKSPFLNEDINLIGSTNLSVSEKHHLRMLLHCLECFKSMSKGNEEGLIPEKEIWLEWCLNQPVMVKDDEFVHVLFEQFSGASVQLQELANFFKVAPLDLTLNHLIEAYQK